MAPSVDEGMEMGENQRDFLLITFAGILIGIIFAYIARNVETPPEAMILLATVQGSFLAIVVSVFLLSLQVNASIFSPLTLEEFGNSKILIGLILLFVSSILVDLLYLITLSEPLFIIPTDLNLTLGIPVALATICLLSLIPIQQIMANLVAPEKVLQRTANNADVENLVRDQTPSSYSASGEIKPPKRTSLLTIEQILISSSNRDDEFSIRQSIYYMFDTISSIIETYPGNNTYSDEAILDGNNFSQHDGYIFDHWETCIEIGKVGGKGRIDLLNATHVQLTTLLIKAGFSESVTTRLTELVSVHLHSFEVGYTETDLIDSYTDLLDTALASEEFDVIEDILSSILSICEELVDRENSKNEYIEDLSGERRDVVAAGLSSAIRCIVTISEHRKVDQDFVRRVSNNAANRIDIILEQLLCELDSVEADNPDAQGIRQNILTELQSAIIDALNSIYHTDEVVATNLAIAAIEISIHRDQSPKQFWRQCEANVDDEDVLPELIDQMSRLESPESLREVSPPEQDMVEFVEKLSTIQE